MRPVNNKSLVAFLFGEMENLKDKKTTVEEVLAHVQIAKQINSQMRYELERTRVLMDLAQHNAIFKDGTNIREIESKNFE
jgi:hypothetical protein